MGHVSRCCGIPMYPTKSLFHELKSTLSDNALKLYKNRAEKYYGHLGIRFPWDDEK